MANASLLCPSIVTLPFGRWFIRLLPLALLALPATAFASGGDATESLTARHMTELVFQLGIIILAARLFAALFTRLKLPSVR